MEGNQNMIRVWGGGIYEHNTFYDICDGKYKMLLPGISELIAIVELGSKHERPLNSC